MTNTVLFVDDEQNVLNSLVRLFIDTDANILTASNGNDGLSLLKSKSVSVVVSDYMMSGMTGVEFLQRAKGISPDSVRILMTACTDAHIAIEAINKGEVFRFVVKPWDNDTLKSMVMESMNTFSVASAMKRADESTLLSLAQTIELKDPYTNGHCQRVADYSMQIAAAMGLSGWEQNQIKHGGWLHDCGKIGVPESILTFEGKLTPEQMDVVKKHAVWGAEVVKLANLPETVINIITYHHEKYDGTGYPYGLAYDAIPLEARIAAVADVYDAITSDRPYRAKRPHFDAIDELTRGRGAAYDPDVVDAFLNILRQVHE